MDPSQPPHPPAAPPFAMLGHQSAFQSPAAAHQWFYPAFYNTHWGPVQQQEFLFNVLQTAGGESSTAGAAAPPANSIGFPCWWLTGNTVCSHLFATLEELMIHLGNVHDVQGPADRKIHCLWCTDVVCGKRYRRDAYRRHIAKHVGYSVPCDDCGKRFSRRDSMRAHGRKHHGWQ